MEKPNIGILLSPDCLLWTKHGLLTPEELDSGDNLIGLDSKSNLSKIPLSEKPFYYGPTKLVSINTVHNNTVLGGNTKIFTPGGNIKAKDIEKGTALEMLSEKKCNELKEICIPRENQRKIFDIPLSGNIAYVLAVAKPYSLDRVQIDPRVNKRLLPDIVKLLIQKLSQMKSEIGGTIEFTPKGNILFTHKEFGKLCATIDFQQENLRWFNGWAIQKSTLTIPKFLRDNGLQIMANFFSGIMAFRCRVGHEKRYVSIQTPKELRLVRSFIQDLAWIFGLNVHKKWVKGNGNHTIEYKADDYDGNINRSVNYTAVKEVTTEVNRAYCLQIPTNSSPLIDNLFVRANKIN